VERSICASNDLYISHPLLITNVCLLQGVIQCHLVMLVIGVDNGFSCVDFDQNLIDNVDNGLYCICMDFCTRLRMVGILGIDAQGNPLTS
jgi:hypothetical protein